MVENKTLRYILHDYIHILHYGLILLESLLLQARVKEELLVEMDHFVG